LKEFNHKIILISIEFFSLRTTHCSLIINVCK